MAVRQQPISDGGTGEETGVIEAGTYPRHSRICRRGAGLGGFTRAVMDVGSLVLSRRCPAPFRCRPTDGALPPCLAAAPSWLRRGKRSAAFTVGGEPAASALHLDGVLRQTRRSMNDSILTALYGAILALVVKYVTEEVGRRRAERERWKPELLSRVAAYLQHSRHARDAVRELWEADTPPEVEAAQHRLARSVTELEPLLEEITILDQELSTPALNLLKVLQDFEDEGHLSVGDPDDWSSFLNAYSATRKKLLLIASIQLGPTGQRGLMRGSVWILDRLPFVRAPWKSKRVKEPRA